MVSFVVRTPKLTDGQILTLADELLGANPNGKAVVSYPVGELSTITAETRPTKQELKDSRQLIIKMDFHFGGTIQEIVSFHRGIVEADHWNQHPNKSGFHHGTPNAYFDEVGFLEPERGYGQHTAHDRLSREEIFAVATRNKCASY